MEKSKLKFVHNTIAPITQALLLPHGAYVDILYNLCKGLLYTITLTLMKLVSLI